MPWNAATHLIKSSTWLVLNAFVHDMQSKLTEAHEQQSEEEEEDDENSNNNNND